MMYMLLLAIQYTIQPRTTRKLMDNRTNKQTAALVEEVVKTSIAGTLLLTRTSSEALAGWTLSSSLVVAAIPAVLYAVQGVLTYTAQQHLDSVTFNGLSQTKTLSAAFFCYLIMNKPQSPIQILALAGLLVSALLFQGVNPFQRNATETKKRSGRRFALGVVPCVAATVLSGLAGAFSQKGLQLTGGTGRDPFLYAMEVSSYSGICLLASVLIQRVSRERKQSTAPTGRLFAHWTWPTLLPVVLKAIGGILTVLVHKHAGSVAKGFALMFGLVLSGILQSALDGENMTVHHVLGTVLVMVSGWAHFTHPPL
jgi:UDP-sugar transporter A1/2/3